jgi:phage-related protein
LADQIDNLEILISSTANAAAQQIDKLTSSLGRLRGSLSSAGGFLSIPKFFGGQLIGNVKKATNTIGTFFKTIKRIATYRLIRTALKEITKYMGEGMTNLYNWSKTADRTFSNSMDRIATSAKYLGNSFAAMASPLVNALAPAIDFIIDKFVDLFNTINQIFSRLAGKSSYTAAKRVATQWGDASKKTGSAVASMKRTILAFDEINKLDKPSSGGSGGGSSAASASGMFETRAISGSISSFADQIKAAFKSSDWKGLGTLIGNEVNKIVDKIDFASIGAKVGNAINGLFTTKYWTLEAINFTNIGYKIAEFLNNTISRINFEYVGRYMVKRMTVIGDSVIGFFTNFNWGQAAGSLSDYVVGLYKELNKWFSRQDWSGIGRTIWEKLKDVIANIDYTGLARNMAEFIGRKIRASADLIGSFMHGVGADIKRLWDEEIKGQNWKETGHNIMEYVGRGFNNMADWVFDNIIDPFNSALFGNDWIQKSSKFFDPLLDGIRTFKNDFDGVGRFLKKLFGEIGEEFKNFVEKIDFEKVGKFFEPLLDGVESFKNGFDDAIKSVKKLLSDIEAEFQKFVNKINQLWNSISQGWKRLLGIDDTPAASKDELSIPMTMPSNLKASGNGASYNRSNTSSAGRSSNTTSAQKTLENLRSITKLSTGAKTALASLATVIATDIKNAGDNIGNPIFYGLSKAVGAVTDTSNGIKSIVTGTTTAANWTINQFWSSVQRAFASASPSLVGNSKQVADSVTNIGTQANRADGNVRQAFTSIYNIISSKGNAAHSAVSSAFSGIATTIASKLSSALSSVTTSTSNWTNIGKNIVNGLKNGINNAWSSLTRTVNNLFNGLSSGVKRLLGIRSPSRVFRDEIGLMIGLGMAEGITDSKPMVFQSMEDLNNGLMNGLTPYSGMSGYADAAAYTATAQYEAQRSGQEANNQTTILQAILNVMQEINDKEFTAEITTSSVQRAMNRTNRRAGTTIVPLGT